MMSTTKQQEANVEMENHNNTVTNQDGQDENGAVRKRIKVRQLEIPPSPIPSPDDNRASSSEEAALREVDFSGTEMTEIMDLSTYWALSVVNLSHNKLTAVDGFQFQDCTYLRVLNLSHNEITTVENMRLPSLIVLLLKFNKLTSIQGLEGCSNLRYLNIANNMITELHALETLPRLMELRVQENDFDLLEIEYLKCLMYLSHLCISPNSCLEVGMPRLMLIFTLQQVRFLDGVVVSPEEILQAQNAFNPSSAKLAFEDHANRLLDKACQSGNMAFDEFRKTHPAPPILLLVGSFKSNIQDITNYLKEKFKYRVMVGGVHSTATTIESGDQAADIPVSAEEFAEMKNRGEFLATSHILGRVCGFGTSQIAKASERGAVLVAPVPLETAISLRKWQIRPKVVLILPSKRPHFNVDDFLEAEAAREKEMLENDEDHGHFEHAEFQGETSSNLGHHERHDHDHHDHPTAKITFAHYAHPQEQNTQAIWTETQAPPTPPSSSSNDSIRTVQFSEANLRRVTELVQDIDADEKIRSRKITAYIPSTHLSVSSLSLDSNDLGSGASINRNEHLGENWMDANEATELLTETANQLAKENPNQLYEPLTDHSDFSDELLNDPYLQSQEQMEMEGRRLSSEETESHYMHNRFKHRDAMEKAILKTRKDYHQYHLDNPGFFTAVYDPEETRECDQEIESLVLEMLEEFMKERENKSGMSGGYAGGCGEANANAKLRMEDQKAFLQHRMEMYRWSTHEWNLGYQHAIEHMKNRHYGQHSEGGVQFSRSSCPKNLFDTNFPRRRFNKAVLQQLEKAGELRREKEKLEMQQALERMSADSTKQHEVPSLHDTGIEGEFGPEDAVPLSHGEPVPSFQNEMFLGEGDEQEDSFTIDNE